MSYAGGKAAPGTFHKIISLMPPHQIYIEPFLGGGAIMRLKRPAQLNIGIDRDRAAIEKARPPAESLAGALAASTAETGERRTRLQEISAETANAGDPAGPPRSAIYPDPSRPEEPADPLARTIDTRSSRWIFNEDDGIEFLRFQRVQ